LKYLLIILASAFAGILVGYLIKNNKNIRTVDSSVPKDIPPKSPLLSHEGNGGVIGLANEKGEVTVFAQEIRRIPNRSQHLDMSNPHIRRVTQLMADSVKGTTGISKRTLEIVFKPDIQEGLTEGTYTMMRTKSGEILADAVDASGKVVGKARVVEYGKLKQLATGVFQLVSIAVAQSHLADIERSLSGIQRSIDQLQNSIDNGLIANISGPLKYLRQVSEKIKNSELIESLSDAQSKTLETISKDAYTSLSNIQEDLKLLTQEASEIVDQQWLGTDECYGRLKNLSRRFEKLNARWILFVELACLTNIIMTYQDPANRIYTRIFIETNEWVQLIENFCATFERKSNELLSNSVRTNSDEMLTFRRESVQRAARETKQESIQISNSFDEININLKENSQTLLGHGKEFALAISVDKYGNVEDAAIS